MDKRKAVATLLLVSSAPASISLPLASKRCSTHAIGINLAGSDSACVQRQICRRLACRRGLVHACAADDVSQSDLVRLARARLNRMWTEDMLKRKPRFLPFIGARQWARAMPLETEEDWMEWISNGEKRNAYVPSRPDEVYADSGWKGWHDFLNGPIEPASVVFQKDYRRGRWLQGPLRDVKKPRDDARET